MEKEAALANAEGIVYKLPADFIEEFNDRFLRTIPVEKAAQELEEARIGRMLQKEGGQKCEGLGQMMGKIPVREYFRHEQANPGCMRNDEYLREFFQDNPHLCAQGYKPKRARIGRPGRWSL